jgi:hypothetical protein
MGQAPDSGSRTSGARPGPVTEPPRGGRSGPRVGRPFLVARARSSASASVSAVGTRRGHATSAKASSTAAPSARSGTASVASLAPSSPTSSPARGPWPDAAGSREPAYEPFSKPMVFLDPGSGGPGDPVHAGPGPIRGIPGELARSGPRRRFPLPVLLLSVITALSVAGFGWALSTRPDAAPPAVGASQGLAPALAARRGAPAVPDAGGTPGKVSLATTVSSTSPWWNEEHLNLTVSDGSGAGAMLTGLDATIRVVRTAGVSLADAWTTFDPRFLSRTASVTGDAIVYHYRYVGPPLRPGTWTLAAQQHGSGTLHSTTGDTYTVTAATGGAARTFTGHF